MNTLPSTPVVATAGTRRRALRDALARKGCLRVIEAHNPFCALIAESARVGNGAERIEYDAFWSSSLTDSAVRGKPDTGALDIRYRLSNIDEIFDVTTKPMIIDGDSGGYAEHFAMNMRTLERLGVSAVIIEDKVGLKRNSLLGHSVEQRQEAIGTFCDKIGHGKAAQLTDEFMVIARVESLVLDAGMSDALRRAGAYVEAGADGIMIHSNRDAPAEILEFAARFRADHAEVPLVCVPTRHSAVPFGEFRRHRFNIVIYANQLLRAAYPAMRKVALAILEHDRTLEAEAQCMPVEDILDLIPGTR